jgi:hypothetical protein
MDQNVNKYLKNIYQNYLFDIKGNVDKFYKAKCLGAMEALLIVLGKLPAGQPFEYRTTKETFWLLWCFPITFNSKETYEQHILRIVVETLMYESH